MSQQKCSNINPVAQFEWDEEKAAANLVKHGVTFEDAAIVFSDPLSLFEEDLVYEGEQRWRVLGRATDKAVLVVIHVYRDRNGTELIRIISARQAERREMRHYERENS